MTYSVKEIFYTLQGEGANTGRPAVFCRFTGCNLWSGREQHRHKAVCQFCDTDFVGTNGTGGGKFKTAQALAERIAATWPEPHSSVATPLVVCTGGEPLLQLDEDFVEHLHQRGFEVAVETNGTKPAPAGIDWLCVSPKADAELVLTAGQEFKLVYPQPEAPPERFQGLAFEHFYLQPIDGPEREDNTRRAVAYCLQYPQWRLSLQTHKLLGFP